MPHHDDAPSRLITVTSGPERAEVVPQRAGLGIDYSATVEAAGLQSASPIERLNGLIREHEVAVVPSVDDAKLTPEITRLQKELHRDPIDAAITLEGGTARERTSEDGQDVPADALHTQLTAHWPNPDGVTVEPQPIAPRIGASVLKEAMDGPVHRALSGPLTVNGREDVKAVIPKERIGEPRWSAPSASAPPSFSTPCSTPPSHPNKPPWCCGTCACRPP